jgi:hypothetical protein
VSFGGLLGREFGDYDPKDPDKFKRLAEEHRKKVAEQRAVCTAPDLAPTQAEMEEKYPHTAYNDAVRAKRDADEEKLLSGKSEGQEDAGIV